MKKYILYALGAASLMNYGCSEETYPNGDDAGTRVGISSPVLQQEFGRGTPGIAHIKVQSHVGEAMQRVALNGEGGISLSSFPSSVAATLRNIKATHVERLFPTDPRFEKRMHKAGLDRWYIVCFDKEEDLKQVMTSLAGSPDFDRVEEVFPLAVPTTLGQPVPISTQSGRATAADMPFNDPYLNRQWHYKNFGTADKFAAGADINLFEAWQQTTGKPNVIVSVVDGGIDVTHEDLKENLWVNAKEIPGNGKDDDGNGYIDDVNGYNFVSNRGTITLDDVGHGTHVAGTIAARNNNGIGVSGIAGGDGTPNSGVRVMSCHIFEDKNGADAARATVYGANNGAVISQNSWGYTYPDPGYLPASMKEAIDYFIKYAGCDNDGNQLPGSPMKGGVVIYAAGNDDTDYYSYPGAYEAVVAVSAMAPDWGKAWYTNRGAWVDIMAPGGDERFNGGEVCSTVPASLYQGAKYGYMQGASMACPHVSGIAALVVSKLGGQGFTNTELRQRLEYSYRPADIDANNPQYVGRLGKGYIDATRALDVNQNKVPAAVAGITAEASFTTLAIQWKAVADEDDGTASMYRIYVSDRPLTKENYVGIEPITVTGAGRTPGDALNYTVEGLKEDSKNSVVSGTEPVKLNVRNLAAGTYTLTVETSKGTYKKVFIKQ